ncbi:MAG: RAMP superfamily CRISPR-associated protein [Crocosphaera sp.]|nr:RAMP superfamily CRISPR-associated protein [Crocosphaera sp.]
MSNNTSQFETLSLTLTIDMLSDWHIGSGTGRTGEIDSLVKRDHNELPYIPAKTITGIWRDNCELLTQGLDENQENGTWQKWVNYLFGDQPSDPERSVELSINKPIPAALSIRPAYFPAELSKLINSKEKTISKQLKQAITFIKPGITIDSQSGCAVQDCLRLEEQVRMGTILTAECTLYLPENEEQQKTAYSLLILSAKLVERLGGNRRRGSGKCRFIINNNSPFKIFKNDDELTAIKWLRNSDKEIEIPETLDDYLSHNNSTSQSEFFSYTNNNNNWVALPLQIELRSPLIIAKRTVGNVVESLDYIPGTHLLKLVARKLGKLGISLTEAITKGDLLVTNATIVIEEQKSQPVPFCLFYEKLTGGLEKLDTGGQVYNRFCEPEPDKKQLKGHRTGYLISTENNTKPVYKTVDLSLGTHNVIEDKYQRPTREVGGVYSYQAIKTGTKLITELRLTKDLANKIKEKKAQWWKTLEGSDRIGQSKKDDYGNVKITVGIPSDITTETEGINSVSDEQLNGKLYVWLLSDLLLRNKCLRPSINSEDLAKELSDDKLGIKVEKIPSKDTENINTLTAIARQNRLESWQVKWGLPRPSLVGNSAGSCFIFQITYPQDSNKITEFKNKLQQLEVSGIGERTAEGYGQISFNHPLLVNEFPKRFEKQDHEKQQQKTQQTSSKSSSKTNLIKEKGEKSRIFNYAAITETAALREDIYRQVTKMASQEKRREEVLGITIKDGESKPSMSQLGALRTVMSRLQSQDDSENIISWIDSVLDNKNRREKWNKESLEEIKKLVNQSNKIWQHININPDLILTENGLIRQQRELWAETIRALISLSILAHKRDLEKPSTQSETQQTSEV